MLSLSFIKLINQFCFEFWLGVGHVSKMKTGTEGLFRHKMYFGSECRLWWHSGYSATKWLLFISYKFVKGFFAITFSLLVISNWNFHGVCQRFLYNQEQNFSLIRQKTKLFPINLHYKVYRHDVTKVGDFYNGGLWGNFSFFVGSNWNFVPGNMKNVDTHHESFS